MIQTLQNPSYQNCNQMPSYMGMNPSNLGTAGFGSNFGDNQTSISEAQTAIPTNIGNFNQNHGQGGGLQNFAMQRHLSTQGNNGHISSASDLPTSNTMAGQQENNMKIQQQQK